MKEQNENCFKEKKHHTQAPDTLHLSSHSLGYPYTAKIKTPLSYTNTG